MTSATSSTATLDSRTDRRIGLRQHVGEQLGVGAGQVAAGIGNLAFSVIAARLLDPGGFATLTAFLALSLLVAVPAGSVAAGTILSTALHDQVTRHLRRVGLGVSVALGVGVAAFGPSVGMPRPLALPAAMLPAVALGLAVARGQLYAHRRPGSVVATLVAEPLVRVTVGTVLLVALGATGGALGVALGGLLALVVAVRALPDHRPAAAGRQTAAVGVQGVAAFLAMALVQNQDVLLVNARLPADAAGTFAALSMLGGAALFAVWNAPLVLMPRAADDPGALRAALGVTAAAGAVATTVSFVAGDLLVTTLVGDQYAGAASLLGPYVAAMSLLGLARVLAGARCARGRARSTAVVTGMAASLQVVLLLASTSVAGAAQATLAASSALAVAMAGAVALDRPVVEGSSTARLGAWAHAHLWSDAPARVATVATGVGLAARLAITRGLWLDEVTTVAQVRLPFGEMLADIAAVDVHPPLHQILLWGWARMFGTGELAVRVPFVLIGAALVPLLFLAGRDLYGRRVGAVAALLGAVAPLAVWYSQEARMYSLYMVFSVLAMWGQGRAMRDHRWSSWGWFALGTAGLLWTHWFALLQIAVQQVVLLVHVIRRGRLGHRVAPVLGRWAAACGAIAVTVVPLVSLLGQQLAAYGQRGAGLDNMPSQTGAAVADLATDLSVYRLAVNWVWALAGYHANDTMVLLVALWPLAMLAAFAVLGRGPWEPPTFVLVAVAVVPVLILFGLGGLKANLFEIRYVIGSVPALLLLIARAAVLPARTAGTVVATGALVVASAVGLADEQMNYENPRRYAFDTVITQLAETTDEGDVVAFAPTYLDATVDYYGPDLDARPLDGLDPERIEGDIHVVASFLDVEPAASAVGAAISELEQERTLVAETTTGNVSVWTFS